MTEQSKQKVLIGLFLAILLAVIYLNWPKSSSSQVGEYSNKTPESLTEDENQSYQTGSEPESEEPLAKRKVLTNEDGSSNIRRKPIKAEEKDKDIPSA